ncbi:helix-turn-helix transcriptional regulator [Paraburkholderia bannensis]|uniref:helix-turn-helix transcriptional regulator n=1 Tax=Paraburkholderia bannensis TaxID=765414 RepID=UPI002AAFD72C|nr:WYL domain-containing protein [Paraburkholderia bannensis]
MLDHEILRILPDESKGGEFVSTPDLHRQLVAFMIDPPVVKTVQRRLEKMFEDQLVEFEKRGTSLVWRKRAGVSGLASGGKGAMTHDEALALHTLRRFSSRQIPSLVAETLSNLFEVATRRLESVNSEHERQYRKWADKVEVESGGFSLQHPPIKGELFSSVSRALFYEQKLEIVYRPRSRTDNVAPRIVHPLGLVEVGGLVYLVAAMARHPNPAMYRLDRMTDAVMLPESFAYPREFSLASYVRQQRQFDFMVEGEVAMKLRFSGSAGDHLIESALSDDQEVTHSGEFLEVRGTVLLSQRLRWWLRSFGPNVEVLEPASLRAELAQEARALAALYAET